MDFSWGAFNEGAWGCRDDIWYCVGFGSTIKSFEWVSGERLFFCILDDNAGLSRWIERPKRFHGSEIGFVNWVIRQVYHEDNQ